MQFFLLLFFPFFILFIVEFISRWDLSKIFFLINNNFPLFVFSYFLIFLLSSTLFLIFRRFSFLVVSLILILLAIINKIKILILWEPFYPADIFLHSWSSKELLKFVNFSLNTSIIIYLLLFILFNIIYYISFEWFYIKKKPRLILLLFLFLLNYYIFASVDFRMNRLQAYTWLNMDSLAWRQWYNYDHNWFIWWFYINIWNIYVKKPENYNEQYIAQIKNEIKSTNLKMTKKPNVIVILSEAFWDINKLPWINFSKNPLENFYKLKNESIYWDLIVPTYWWKTVRTEFEVLSWNMMKFLPSWSIPYQQYIKKDIPSIPFEFKNNWYATLALHTYEKNFFNRANTYPFLGFDKFVWAEDLTNPKYKWPFISDEEFVNDLVYYFKNNKQLTNKPQFIFGISMQNHFTYEWTKYDNYSVSFSWNNLTHKNKQIIANYAQWITDADEQLWYLVNYLNTLSEPTYLLYFWDHLWAMWEDYYSYKETWYINSTNESDWSQDDFKKMYSTPFLIRNNFWDKTSKNIWSIGSSFIWNYLLDLVWINKENKYFDFIANEYNNCIKASTVKITLNSNNKDCDKVLDEHNLLQYDILFWDNYISK